MNWINWEEIINLQSWADSRTLILSKFNFFIWTGHGPFSHTFERFAKENANLDSENSLVHEIISPLIIDQLLSNVTEKHPEQIKIILNNLDEQGMDLNIWKRHDLQKPTLDQNSSDLQFIKDLIVPPKKYHFQVCPSASKCLN